MKTALLRTALIAAAIVAIGAFALLSIGGADAQQACIQSLAGNGTVNGTWDNTCLSENTPLSDGDYDYPVGTRYARFYTFTLSAPSTVTMELKSSVDTYMYLMLGKGKTGTIDDSDDDISNEDTNSRISKILPVGDYTIEATTFGVEAAGTFTLTVSGLPDASTPTVTPTTSAGDTPTVTPTAISGQDTPTPTPTPTRTPTPAPTTVPTDVLNRLSALETLAVRQQGRISTLESKVTALDGRVATLEAGASTATLTPISGQATSTSTPEPTRTATPTPKPIMGLTRDTAHEYGKIFETGILDMQITALNEDAFEYLNEHDPVAFDEDPDDHTYMIWTIEIKNARGSEYEAEGISPVFFALVGSSATEINGCGPGIVPNRLRYSIYLNAMVSGDLCFKVPDDESDLVLRFHDTWFRATPVTP